MGKPNVNVKKTRREKETYGELNVLDFSTVFGQKAYKLIENLPKNDD